MLTCCSQSCITRPEAVFNLNCGNLDCAVTCERSALRIDNHLLVIAAHEVVRDTDLTTLRASLTDGNLVGETCSKLKDMVNDLQTSSKSALPASACQTELELVSARRPSYSCLLCTTKASRSGDNLITQLVTLTAWMTGSEAVARHSGEFHRAGSR